MSALFTGPLERFGAERGEGREAGDRLRRPQVDRAEAPRIVERDAVPRLGVDHEMVVRQQLARIEPPAPRHAEVEDHRLIAIGCDQPIFGASAQTGDRRSGHHLTKVGRERPAQVATSRFDGRDPRTFEDGAQASDGRLDFG